ncbi:hypothetical protein OGAPHI_005106 [Ogataea philodendri]|uniref:Uncharacterized protein n=1 Tax=Ogataea philodendri TaxID=1378263 RepID=A0A9P8P1S3_9ASCO|nr:uncharacterized protein OGAPHI_005106 [Ogataea philodendri]KAH3663705.1 hypothetical protein OGAPHI_005106 [Ogataea philodendri]
MRKLSLRSFNLESITLTIKSIRSVAGLMFKFSTWSFGSNLLVSFTLTQAGDNTGGSSKISDLSRYRCSNLTKMAATWSHPE